MRSVALRLRAGLGLVLLASVGLGVARAWAVPPGYNVDEWARLPPAIRQAACWKLTFPWLGQAAATETSAECWAHQHYQGNPLYYLLLSIPLAFVPEEALATQYHVARLVTVGLGLATLGLAWLTCRELFGRRAGRLALIGVSIAAATALNQNFGDIASGVNSDASAVAALALLTYALARFEARRGGLRQRLGNVGLVLLAGLACRWSAASAWWLGLPVMAWWLVSQLGPRVRLGALAVLAVVLLAALLIPGWVLVWQSPQHWFNAGPTEILGASKRVAANGPVGPHALALRYGDKGRVSYDEVQFLPDPVAASLAGNTITFGAWVRGPQGEIVYGPIWDDGSQQAGQTVTATGDWQFVAAQVVVSPAARTGAIVLRPPESGAVVFFDGLVLAEGEFPTDAPPDLAEASGRAGTWGGKAFANLLLNPSVEDTWPELKTKGMPRDFVSYNGRIRSLLAGQRTAAAYPAVASWLFAGFWSEFSGLHPGLSKVELIPAALFTLAGALGALLTAFAPPRRARPELRQAVRFFAPIALIIWVSVLLRADLWPNLLAVLSFAGARYAVTATVPTLALLVIGGLYWLPPRLQPKALAALCFGLWLISLHVILREQIPFYRCLLEGSGTGSCLGGS